MDLDSIRKELNMYDNIIKNMITLRMSLIPMVAKVKIDNNLPLVQTKRESEIYNNIEVFAKENGIDKDLVKDIYKLIISNALKIEDDFVNNPDNSVLSKNINFSEFKNLDVCFKKLDNILSNEIPDIISNIKTDDLKNLSLNEIATLYYNNKLNNN